MNISIKTLLPLTVLTAQFLIANDKFHSSPEIIGVIIYLLPQDPILTQNINDLVINLSIKYSYVLKILYITILYRNDLVIDDVVILVDFDQMALVHSLKDQNERVNIYNLYGLCN